MIKIPENLKKIINKIEDNGYEAYIVGGAVRDIILKKDPRDWDVVSSASYEMLKKIFFDYHKVEIGKKFGIIIIVIGKEKYEIVAYEKWEGIAKDLKRRDFTINAMAYHLKNGIIDIYGGRKDIEKKLIKTTQDVNVIFEDDKLRVLRAIRFAGELGFGISDEIIKYIKNNKNNFGDISRERIGMEIIKILIAKESCYSLRLMAENSILDEIFELESDKIKKNIWYDNLKNSFELRFAVFINEFVKNGKGNIKKIVKELKYSNKMEKNTKEILQMINFKNIPEKIRDVREVMSKYKLKNIELYLNYIEQSGKDVSKYKKLITEVIEKNYPIKISQLAISGNDLKKIGLQDKEIGSILRKSLKIVIDNPEKNTKEYLLKIAKNK